MRFWLQSSVKTSALSQSTVFSVVTHAVLMGVAVYSTGVNARLLDERVAQRIAYLPPPDRRPTAPATQERVQYIDVGFGALAAGATQEGDASSLQYTQKTRDPGELTGKDLQLQMPSIEYVSPDSVYSILEVDEQAARMAGSAAPVYPADLIRDKVEGGVFLRFVVDTNGRADPASIEVVRSTHVLFLESVQNALPRMAFTAAKVGGQKVRQAVEQNFEFKITPNRFAPVEQTRTKPVP